MTLPESQQRNMLLRPALMFSSGANEENPLYILKNSGLSKALLESLAAQLNMLFKFWIKNTSAL